MSFSCWKAIGSPPLTESQNTLRAFNGSGFKPYGVLPSLPVTLEGKTVQVEVEVFDAPLDYNLLLFLCVLLYQPFFVFCVFLIKDE